MPDDGVQVIHERDLYREIALAIKTAKNGADCLFDTKTLPVLSTALSESTDSTGPLRNNGAKLRCVTSISRENLAVCKGLMKEFDIFHTAGVSGSFIISDGREYLGYVTSEDGSPALMKVTNKSFVESQKFLLGTILNAALPAKQRIQEISKGSAEQFMETVRDPVRVRALISDLIRSAIYEIAILFSTRNSFLLAEQAGILSEVAKVSTEGIKVRLLVMQDQTVKEISDNQIKSVYPNIQVNYLQQLLTARITTLIIDQATILSIEVSDKADAGIQEAIGLSTYSNSDSTVFSNISIFESLWIQAEVDKQTNARQAYFKLFKGFKLKDEVYNRRWIESRGESEK